MSFIMRKCIVNVKHVRKCRAACVFMRIESQQSLHINNRLSIPEYNRLRRANFHTSQTDNKIVAFKLSDIGEGIREVVIKEWFVKVGDEVQQFDNICEVQSDKAAVTITSRYDGVVTRLYHEVDQTALVGQPLIDVDVPDGVHPDCSAETDAVDQDNQVETKLDKSQRVKVLTTPAVRRIASQFKVDLSTVKATGRNGRVLKEDMLAHLNINSDNSNEVPSTTSVKAMEIPVMHGQAKVELLLEDRVVPVSGFMKAMVKSMTEAMKIPHFVYSDEYDVSNLVECRAALKAMAQERAVRLTYMPIIIKAASLSLRQLPVLNSCLDSGCERLTYRASHNIGVAMDTPNGLLVPVVKNVQSKTILDIARELNTLQEKGSKGQLGPNELSGGTFTISNIGIFSYTWEPCRLRRAAGSVQVVQIELRSVADGAPEGLAAGVTWNRASDHPFTNILKKRKKTSNFFTNSESSSC